MTRDGLILPIADRIGARVIATTTEEGAPGPSLRPVRDTMIEEARSMGRQNREVLDRLVDDAARGRLTRRELALRAAAIGVSVPAAALLRRSTPLALRRKAARW